MLPSDLPKTPRNPLIKELDDMLVKQTTKATPTTPKPAQKLELPSTNFDQEEKEIIETIEGILEGEEAPKLFISQIRTLKYQLKSLFTAQKLERVNLIQAYDKVSMTLSLKEMSQTKRIEKIKQQEDWLKQKEDDMNHEIQALLGTIDDHKKLNEKLNKHFKKRLQELESDCNSMLQLESNDLIPKISQMQLKIRDFIDVQVRHKDPLDGHDHLIASSRQMSTRQNQYQFGFNNRRNTVANPGDQTQRTVDRGFIQSTARSNLYGLPSGRMTIRTNTNGFGGLPRKLCDTCLTGEELSLVYSECYQYDKNSDNNHVERKELHDDRFKGMTLHEKEQMLMQQLLEQQNQMSQHNGSLDVKTEEVLGSQSSDLNDNKKKPSLHKTSKGFSLGSARQPIEMTFFNNTQSIAKVSGAKTSRPPAMMIDENLSSQEPESSQSQSQNDNDSSFKNESLAVQPCDANPVNENEFFDDLNQLSAIKQDQSQDDLLLLSQDFPSNNHGQSSFQTSFVFTSITDCEKPNNKVAKVINAGNSLIKIPALNLAKITGQNKEFFKNNVKTIEDDDANSSSISISEDKSNKEGDNTQTPGTPHDNSENKMFFNIVVETPKIEKHESEKQKKYFELPSNADPQQINFTLGQQVTTTATGIQVLAEQKNEDETNFFPQPISPEDSRNLSKTTASGVQQESSHASIIQDKHVTTAEDLHRVVKKHNIVNKYRQILYQKKTEKPEILASEFNLKPQTGKHAATVKDVDSRSFLFATEGSNFPPLNSSKDLISLPRESSANQKKRKYPSPKLLGQRGFKRTTSAKRKGGPITHNIFGDTFTPKAESQNPKPKIYQTHRGDEKENNRNNFKIKAEVSAQDIKLDQSDKLSLLKKLTRNANFKNSMKDFKKEPMISQKFGKQLNYTTIGDEMTHCKSFRDASADNNKNSLVGRSRYKMIKKLGC